MAVAWMYLNPLVAMDGPIENVLEMVNNIRASFSKFIYDADWMDTATKIATLEKNKKMTSQVGYPKWLFDEGELDEYYAGVLKLIFFNIALIIYFL